VFGTFGNQIFDDQKDFYVFRDFSTNVRNDLLDQFLVRSGDRDAPRPVTRSASTRDRHIDVFSAGSTDFTSRMGHIVRLRALAIGYPCTGDGQLDTGARIYVQAEKCTLPGTRRSDPSCAGVLTRTGGRHQGSVSRCGPGSYPTSRTFTVGISTTF